MTVIINVRKRGDQYIARSAGYKPTCSQSTRYPSDVADRLATRIADGRKFTIKKVTDLTYLCEIDDVHDAKPSSDAENYRVGRREGQKLWQIKIGPGWGIIHQCATLKACSDWLIARGVDTKAVSVLTAGDWKTLHQYIEKGIEP